MIIQIQKMWRGILLNTRKTDIAYGISAETFIKCFTNIGSDLMLKP